MAKTRARKFEQSIGGRACSVLLFLFFEGFLPIVPFVLLILKDHRVSRDVLLITSIMGVAGIVNLVKNGGGLLFAFVAFMWMFAAVYLQNPALPGTIQISNFQELGHAFCNWDNITAPVSLFLMLIVLSCVMMMAYRFHGCEHSEPHWALPIMLLFLNNSQVEKDELG